MKKFLTGLGIALTLGVLLEVFIFNISYWQERKDTSAKKNIIYTLDQMEKINWSKTSQGWISGGDQHLIIKDVNTRINTITIDLKMDTKPDYVLLFYKEDGVEEFNDKSSILVEGSSLAIGSNVTDLRIDISNKKDIVINSLNLIINPMQFRFSFSRAVAVLLICSLGYGLFAIQKSPEYEV